MRSTNRLIAALPASFGLAVVLATAVPVQAGPPLICHRFETNGAPSLPWGRGDGWDAALPTYDVTRLTADTISLLTPGTPVRARMETLRRATVYATRDPKVAQELLTRVMARAVDAAFDSRPDAFALFDAGYLIESYRQASQVFKWDMLDRQQRAGWALKDEPAGLDGLAWVQHALRISKRNPDIAYAASLMEGDRARAASLAPATARR